MNKRIIVEKCSLSKYLLMGKHDEKSSLFSCHYLVAICACIPQKKLLSKNLSPLRYGQLKTLLFITSCCGWGFVVMQIGEQLPWLVK